jgi:hypothetical protein
MKILLNHGGVVGERLGEVKLMKYKENEWDSLLLRFPIANCKGFGISNWASGYCTYTRQLEGKKSHSDIVQGYLARSRPNNLNLVDESKWQPLSLSGG